MLKGKCVVLGVTGSIAAYKIASLASALVKLGADVNVIMTKNATNFINPITFETLTSNKCLVDTFDRNFQFNVEHVALAKRARRLPIGAVSIMLLGSATFVGWLLGGPVGIGTIICAFATGPIMQAAFTSVRFDATQVHHQHLGTSFKTLLHQ